MCFFGSMYMMSTCLLVLFVLRAVGTFDLCFRLAFAFLFKSPSLSPNVHYAYPPARYPVKQNTSPFTSRRTSMCAISL